MIDNSYIQNLQKRINETAIYAPTGKYGKNELDEWATDDAKLKLLLSANPNTIENIVAYVQYIESLDAFKNQKIYKKVCTLLKHADEKDSEGKLVVAHEILQEYERRLESKRKKGYIKLSIVAAPFILWYFSFVLWWDLGWQIVWLVIFLIILRITYGSISEFDKDKDAKYNPFE